MVPKGTFRAVAEPAYLGNLCASDFEARSASRRDRKARGPRELPFAGHRVLVDSPDD